MWIAKHTHTCTHTSSLHPLQHQWFLLNPVALTQMRLDARERPVFSISGFQIVFYLGFQEEVLGAPWKKIGNSRQVCKIYLLLIIFWNFAIWLLCFTYMTTSCLLRLGEARWSPTGGGVSGGGEWGPPAGSHSDVSSDGRLNGDPGRWPRRWGGGVAIGDHPQTPPAASAVGAGWWVATPQTPSAAANLRGVHVYPHAPSTHRQWWLIDKKTLTQSF